MTSRNRKSGQGATTTERGSAKKSKGQGLLSDDELKDIAEQYVSGITAVQVVEIFTSREVRFSEATFRKYVQQGLLPRSRRVGSP